MPSIVYDSQDYIIINEESENNGLLSEKNLIVNIDGS